MRIGELARRSGLSRDTIRFYERQGLIASQDGGASTNNYRDYSEEAAKRLAFIAMARDAGLSVADLKELVATMEGIRSREQGLEVVAARIAELEESMAKSRRVLDFLHRAQARLEAGED